MSSQQSWDSGHPLQVSGTPNDLSLSGGTPKIVQSGGPPTPKFAFNASGLYWGVAPDAMMLNLPTVSLAVATTECAIAQAATLSHNSTTYIWSSSGTSACGGVALSETLGVYVTNTSNAYVKEVYVKGSYTKEGPGSVSTLLNFPLSFSGSATVNSTGAFLPGSAFEWAKITQFSPVWNSSSDSLTVASTFSAATAVTFSYDPTLVQTANCAVAACAFSSNITSGNLLVVASSYSTVATNPFAPTISDSKSNSWSQAVQQVTYSCGVSYCYSTIWYATASSSGPDTVTIGPGSQAYTTFIFEVGGASGTVLGTATGAGTYCAGVCSAPLLLQTGSSVSFSSYGFAVGALYPGCASSTANEAGYSIGINTGTVGEAVVYSTSGVSSPTRFGINLQSGGGCIRNYVNLPYIITGAVFALGTAIQPVQCTMANGASSVTLTLSGGSPSPSTVACDGSTHNITVFSSSTLTATEPSDGSTQRQRFSGGGTTTSTSACSWGTCSTWSFTNYNQYKPSVAYSVTCASGATCNAPILTYYQYGSITNSTLSTTSTSYWIDQGIASVSTSITDTANDSYTPYFSSWLIASATAIDTPIVYWEGL